MSGGCVVEGKFRPISAVPHSRYLPTHGPDSGHSPRGPRRQQIAKTRLYGLRFARLLTPQKRSSVRAGSGVENGNS